MLSRHAWKASLSILLAGLLLVSQQPVQVSAASTFSICAQFDGVNNCPPSTSTVQATQTQGGSSTFTIVVKNITGNPSVSLQIVNPPDSSLFHIQIGPVSNNAPWNATVIVTSFASTPPNPYLIIIQGTNGSESHQASFIVNVTAGSFTITPTPSSRSIGAGDSAQFILSIQPVGGFSQTAFLTAIVPVTCTGCASNIAPSQNIPPFSATMLVTTSTSTGSGSYVFEVDGHISNSTGPIVYSAGVTVIVGAANFTVSVTPTARNVTAGGQAPFSVSVAAVGSFNMPVSLTASVPSGFSESISPSLNVPPYSAKLLVGVPNTASAATYLVTVTGSSGGSTYQTSVQLNVRLWNFTVSISPPSVSMSQGGSATFMVSVQKTNNFTGVVSLSASASASNINTTLLPSSGSPNYTSTMRVDVGFSVSPGTYIVLVQASGGGVSRVALANVVVQAGSWTIQISPTSTSISQGSSGTFNVSVTRTGGFVGAVTLTASAPPSLGTALLPSSGTPNFMAVLRVQVSPNVSPGSYVVIVQGSDSHGGTAVATATVNVGSSSFTVTATPSAVSIYQTQSATFTVSISPVGGFSSAITLSVSSSSNSSAGIQAQLGPTAGTPPFTATLIVSTSTGVSPDPYIVTVQGAGGGNVAQAAVIVTVLQKPPSYTIVVSTQGLGPPASSNLYLDGVLQSQTVNDNSTATLGPFDGLTAHTVAVDSNVTLTSVEYLVNGASSISVSNFVSLAAQIPVRFKYTKYWLATWSTSSLPSNTYLALTVGGSSYYEFTPFTLQTWQQDGVQLSFSVPSQLQVSGRTYGLVAWKDASGKQVASPVTVTAPLTLTAYYAPAQWFLTVYDQQGANVTFSSNTQTVTAAGYVVFAAVNGTYQLTTSEVILQSAGVGSHFKTWTNPTGSNNTQTTLTISVTLTGDLKVTVTRGLQYLLTLQSDYGMPQGGGWYDSGSTAQFSVNSPISHGSGSQYACVGYGGDVSGSGSSGQIAMTGPKTVRFRWQLQYQLTVNSAYGSVHGAGWYGNGTTAAFNVSPPSDPGVRYTFQGWTGDFSATTPSGSLIMDGPKTVTANWSRQFQTTLVFVDARNMPLADTPSSVTLTSPSNTAVQFAANESMWLDEGAWKVSSVILHGVEVSNGGSYNTLPNGKWTIQCQVYAMQVNVQGMLFAGSISGVKVSLKLLDGTAISGVTDSSGQTELDDVPAGTYYVQATGLLTSGTVRADASNFTIVNIRMFAPVEIGGLAAVAAVGVAAIALALRARRGGPPRTPKRPPHEEEQSSESQEETTTEESGELGEGLAEGTRPDDDLKVEV